MVKFIGVILITLLFVEYAAPIQFIKRFFNVWTLDSPKETYKQVIQKLVGCAMCSGFWIGLAFYQSLYWAAIIAFCSEILNNILKRLNLL